MASQHILYRTLAVLGALLLLVACGAAQSPASPSAGTSMPAEQTATSQANAGQPGSTGSSLEGTKWVLTEFGPPDAPVAVPAGTQVTIEFANGQAGGTAPCNQYGGSYSVDGQKLTIGEITQTMRACADNNLMDLESRYLDALRKATTFAIEGDRLTINYDGGVMHFTRDGAAAQ